MSKNKLSILFSLVLLSAIGVTICAVYGIQSRAKIKNPVGIKNIEPAASASVAAFPSDIDDAYKKIAANNLSTSDSAPVVWEKDFALRVKQAEKITRPKIARGKYIDINLAAQVLTIFEDGDLLGSFMISSGKRGLETPKGNFKIENKSPRPWSKAYGLYMPKWMALVPSGKFGIHELPEWPGGYKEGANHLGTPVSHGCVRLGVGAAEKVYNWAEIGTPVIIY